MLINTNQKMAIEYLNTCWDQIGAFDELLQLAVIELIRKDCRSPQADKV